MAKTLIDFTPASDANFQFQATFDGDTYTVICTWNLFGVRYYINIYDLSGNLIVCRPLIGSPQNYDISLAAGYFTTALVFRQASRQFEIID